MIDVEKLGQRLGELAEKMLEDAAKEGVPLPHRLDVFKICSQHYVSLAKVKGRNDPTDADDTPTMGQLRERVSRGTGDTDESPSGGS